MQRPLVASSLAVVLLAVTAAAQLPDGSWSDAFFRPDLDDPAVCVLPWQDGVVVSGEFTVAGPLVAQGIVRHDGESWQTMGPGIPGGAVDLCTHDGELYAGIGGGLGVLRWTGTAWTSAGTGAPNWVGAIASYDGHLYLVGQLGLFRLDGGTWNLVAGTDDWGRRLLVHDGLLLVGGEFHAANGVAAVSIFGWDGQSVQAVYQGLPSSPESLVVHDGVAYATYWHQEPWQPMQSYIVGWDGSAWVSLADLPADIYVRHLASIRGQLHAAGWDHGPVPSVAFLWRWTGSAWEDVIEPVAGGTFHDLCEAGGQLWLAGEFPGVEGVAAANLVVHDGQAWRAPFTGGAGLDGVVHDLAPAGERLLVGGEFQAVGDLGSPLTAAWNGEVWDALTGWTDLDGQPIEPGSDSEVDAVVMAGDHLLAGGYLGYGLPSFSAEWLAGTGWSVISHHDIDVYQVWGDWVYAGTGYDPDGALVLRRSVAGGDWEVLARAEPGSAIRAMTVWNDQLVVGGSFYGFAGEDWYGLVAFDGEAWSEVGDGVPGQIYALAEHAGDLIVGGWFDEVGNGITRRNIARWTGSQWLSEGDVPEGHVHALAVHEGYLVAGGCFPGIGGVGAARLAIHDGQQWQPLGNPDGTVAALASHDGHLYAGGSFSTVGGLAACNLACWTFDQPTAVQGDDAPEAASLRAMARPNPFNPSTSLHFELERTGPVRLDVVDLRGRRVRRLVDAELTAGPQRVDWNGRDERGRALPSGSYLVRLEAGGKVRTEKILLAR